MRKSLFTLLLTLFFLPLSFSQAREHLNGGRFLKRIEDNFRNSNYTERNGEREYVSWNFDSKTEVEMLLFGDFNAKVEFLYAQSFEGDIGFRIVRDSTNTSFLLEVKRISNYKEAAQKAYEKYPSIGIPSKIFCSMPEDIMKLIREHNGNVAPKQDQEKLELYQVETLSYPVSDRFVEVLYAKMVSAIDTFKVIGAPSAIFDGYRVTFRCIVGDELWSLNIHVPLGEILIFSDLCRQMLTDATAGTFDEANYIKLLEK